MSIGRRRTIEIDRTPAQPDQAAVGAALSVLDRFMVALNAGDEPALLATLHCMRHEGAEGAVPTFALLLANRRRCPTGGASGQPVAGRLAVVIDRNGLLREGSPVVQAINVDDGAGPQSGLADRADINAQRLQIRNSAVPVPKR